MKKLQEIVRSRKFRNLCGLIALILVIVIVSYFITSYTQFSDSGLTVENLAEKIYMSSDGIIELSFSDTGALFVTEKAVYDFESWSYKESVISMTKGETTFCFWVMEDGRVFSREERIFLYEVIA